jgi:hypothetical protein
MAKGGEEDSHWALEGQCPLASIRKQLNMPERTCAWFWLMRNNILVVPSLTERGVLEVAADRGRSARRPGRRWGRRSWEIPQPHCQESEEEEHHGAVDHTQDGGQRLPQEAGRERAEEAVQGDWEGGSMYQILRLMYIYLNEYFFIVSSFNGL